MKFPSHLEFAFKEIGVEEFSGKKDNKRIMQYLKSCSFVSTLDLHDEVPWCAAFVNFVLKECGLNNNGKALARSFLETHKKVKNPSLGDITVFSRGTQPWQGHVAFFLDKSAGNIYVLGGNQNNRVGIGCFNEGSVLGYRSPLV